MNVEVLAVGTELLLGQIVNGNAATIGSRLAEAGLHTYRQTVVGDNLDRVADAVREACGRADALIVTGGLGPTQDDLTREALCAATGSPMVFDEVYATRLRSWWASRGREMPSSNLRQAQHPQGAHLIDNPKGTAPGLDLEFDGKRVFALPGVPEEMTHMLDAYVIPELRRAAGDEGVLVSRLVRTWGLPESKVGEILADLYVSSVNPTVAFLASGGEIKVRLSARAATEQQAGTLIAPVEAEVRRRLGRSVFGVDGDTIESVVLRLLAGRSWTLATAESATGGMVAARITGVPGASAVFLGSIVAYTTGLKRDLLGVEGAVLAAGVVSEPTALAMAEGAASRLGADVAVAVTGSAGPDPQEQPPGTMVFAVRTPEDVRARTMRLPGDRERVRTYATMAALQHLRLAVAGDWW